MRARDEQVAHAFAVTHMSGRALTPGEIALARAVFKDAIDYRAVKIHHRRFVFFQANNSGMTPNGEIYIVGERTYAPDYAFATKALKGFFIHEMAHVWQYQRNILRPITAAIAEYLRHRGDYAKAYRYELVTGKDLRDYRIEQQAQIIQDFFLRVTARAWARAPVADLDGDAALYTQVLAHFLADPTYA